MLASELLRRARDIASYAVGNTFYDCAKFAEAVIPLLEREAARDAPRIVDETKHCDTAGCWYYLGHDGNHFIRFAHLAKPIEAEAQPMWKEERAFQRRMAIAQMAATIYASSNPDLAECIQYSEAIETAEDLMREVERAGREG